LRGAKKNNPQNTSVLTIHEGGNDMMKSLFALVLALLSLTATAATKYYIVADVVRGAAGAQGSVCVANTVFFPGEQAVWRAIVFDAASHTPLSLEQAKSLGMRVTVSIDNGTNLNMRLGLHPPDPKAPTRALFWSINYPISAAAPVGTLKWTLTSTDSEGNTGSFTPIGQETGQNLLTIAKPAAAALKTSATDGPGLYAQYCASCHQANGQGLPGAFPPLAGSSVANGDSAYLTQMVLSGFAGRITVKGQTYDGNMPAMGTVLNDAQLAEILTYVRSTWNNKAAAVNAGMVKAARANIMSPQQILAQYPK
jgi:mono/diheme cytochrome c family protein